MQNIVYCSICDAFNINIFLKSFHVFISYRSYYL